MILFPFFRLAATCKITTRKKKKCTQNKIIIIMGKRNNNNTTEMIMWANSFSRYIRLSIGARKMYDRLSVPSTMLTHLHTHAEVTLKWLLNKTTMCNTFYLFLNECGHWLWREQKNKRPTDRPYDEIINGFSARRFRNTVNSASITHFKVQKTHHQEGI